MYKVGKRQNRLSVGRRVKGSEDASKDRGYADGPGGEVVRWKHVGRCSALPFRKNQSRMDLFSPRSIRNATKCPNWIM